MQPSSAKPVMDVTAPARTEHGGIAVHEAPVDPTANVAAANEVEQKQEPVADKQPAPKPVVKRQHGAAIAVFFTVIAMLALSSLAVMIYLKS